MYDRTIESKTITLGNSSAVYESDMLMFDHGTGSYWLQITGEAIVGPLTGKRLKLLPSQTTTWGLWKKQFPDTQVLSRKTGFMFDYKIDWSVGLGQRLNRGEEFFYPVSMAGRDSRLQPGEVVLSVQISGSRRAYPIEQIGDAVINDRIDETSVVIFSAADGPTGAAYVPIVKDQLLTFLLTDGVFRDDQTGSTWNLAGLATDGDLAGTQLEALPVCSTFWFALVASYPDIEVYRDRSTWAVTGWILSLCGSMLLVRRRLSLAAYLRN